MEEKFYYVEGNSSVRTLLKSLAKEITKNAGDHNWRLIYPSNVEDIGGSSESTIINLITDGSTTNKVQTEYELSNAEDKCILSTTTSYGKKFYVKIERQQADLSQDEVKSKVSFQSLHSYYEADRYRTRTDAQVLELMSTNGTYDTYVSAMTKSNAINNFIVQISDRLNATSDDLGGEASIPSRLAWYSELQPTIKDWLPVEYWININKNAINIVLRGDPSADAAPYDNYLTSYAYIGAISPVEDSATTDDIYNFAVTTGADIEPIYSQKYGERTATGTTDVCMIANRVGIPIQPHYPAFYSANPFMDKVNFNGSRWNHKKHQFSDITLVHPVDMERGKMVNVLAGDASAINDTDKLAFKKDTPDEEYYKKFTITAPYNFLNNSANVNYCLAIRCYKTTD